MYTGQRETEQLSNQSVDPVGVRQFNVHSRGAALARAAALRDARPKLLPSAGLDNVHGGDEDGAASSCSGKRGLDVEDVGRARDLEADRDAVALVDSRCAKEPTEDLKTTGTSETAMALGTEPRNTDLTAGRARL
jgi:hypothetical protein